MIDFFRFMMAEAIFYDKAIEIGTPFSRQLLYNDYLDFLEWDEVTDSVMYGYDDVRREFVVLKFLVEYPDGRQANVMQTHHRRYSDSNMWVSAGHATKLIFIPQTLTSQHFAFLDTVLDGMVATLDSSYCSDFPSGTTVRLY